MGVKRDFDSACLSGTEFTEDEAALYDRQIRLWGIESQKRLRETKILIIGLNGLGAEVAKNLVLAGIKSLTLMDDKNIDHYDKTAQFLVAGCDMGINRAEASKPALSVLNPNVEILWETGCIGSKSDGFYADFNVICAIDCPISDLIYLNALSRKHSIKFHCGSSWGFYGYSFLDLGLFNFISESVAKLIKTEIKRTATRVLQYCTLEKALSLKIGKPGIGLSKKTPNVFFMLHIMNAFYDKHKRLPHPEHRYQDIEELKSIRNAVLNDLGFEIGKVSDEMLSNVFGNLSPVCAIIGGTISQEIIKSISEKGDPIYNFFFFDGQEYSGNVVSIGNGSN